MQRIHDIMARLPHRYPMLLIDRVLESSPTTVIAQKNVTINEPFFVGHFPNNPIMPGALILDALAQASAFLEGGNGLGVYNTYLAAVDKARFKRPVVPGDQLLLKIDASTINKHLIRFIGQAYVDDVIVAEAELTTMWSK